MKQAAASWSSTPIDVVRLVRLSELPALHTLFMQSLDTDFIYFEPEFKKRFRQEHNLSRLAKAYFSPRAQILILIVDGRPSGYSLVRHTPDGSSCLHWMYVVPEYRGLGYGERLLRQAIKLSWAHGSVKLVLYTHDKADFYARYGFAHQGIIPGLLGGADMTVMELIYG